MFRDDDPIRKMAEMMQGQQRLLEKVTIGQVGEMVKKFQELDGSFCKIQADLTSKHVTDALSSLRVAPAFDKYLKQEVDLFRFGAEIQDHRLLIQNISEKIAGSMVALAASVRLLSPPRDLLSFRLALPVAYQTFAVRQVSESREEPEETAGKMLEVTELAGDLLDIGEASFEAAAEFGGQVPSDEQSDSDDRNNGGGEPSVNLFDVVGDRIRHVYSPLFTGDLAVEVKSLQPFKICLLGVKIAEGVVLLNKTFELEGREPIFKPTTMAMQAMACLPCLVAQTEQEFGVVVDRLYFLLYEGSGEAKRLLKIANDADLQELWRLKHLRLGFRHDLDHGDTSRATRRLSDVGNAYKSLIGRPYPVEAIDWTAAQLALYEQIMTLVSRVLSKF